MATAEFEIDTDEARSLLEIGFDLGVAACIAALGLTEKEDPWSCLYANGWPQVVERPVNPFRRASTEIVEPVRPESCRCGTEYTCKIACTCSGYPHDYDCHYGQGWEEKPRAEPAANLTVQSVPDVVKQIERVEADAAANARAHAQASAEHYTGVAREHDVEMRDTKSDLLSCECERGTHCGKRPAGNFMKRGWPDALILCEECEANACVHEVFAPAEEVQRVQTATVCPELGAGRDCPICGPLPTRKARP